MALVDAKLENLLVNWPSVALCAYRQKLGTFSLLNKIHFIIKTTKLKVWCVVDIPNAESQVDDSKCCEMRKTLFVQSFGAKRIEMFIRCVNREFRDHGQFHCVGIVCLFCKSITPDICMIFVHIIRNIAVERSGFLFVPDHGIQIKQIDNTNLQ